MNLSWGSSDMKRDECDGSLAKMCIIHSQYRMNSKILTLGISLSYLNTSNILEELSEKVVRGSVSILYNKTWKECMMAEEYTQEV